MRADRLSARLRARYARHDALVRAPEMALAARAVPVTLLASHHHAPALHWAPRLQLLVQGGGARGAWAGATGDATARTLVRHERLETVLRRIVSRTERVETTGSPAPPAAAASATDARRRDPWAASTPAAAPARVFQKPAARRVSEAARAVTAPEGAAPSAGAARWPGWPPARGAAPPAPVDVERLTDQVMNTIGRRMAAHRERRGR